MFSLWQGWPGALLSGRSERQQEDGQDEGEGEGRGGVAVVLLAEAEMALQQTFLQTFAETALDTYT